MCIIKKMLFEFALDLVLRETFEKYPISQNGETQDFMNLSLFLPATPATFTFPTTPIFHDDHFGKLNSVTNFFMRSLEALGRGKCLCVPETVQLSGVTFRISKSGLWKCISQ